MMKMNFTIPNKPKFQTIIQTQSQPQPQPLVISASSSPAIFGSMFESLRPTGPCTSCGHSK